MGTPVTLVVDDDRGIRQLLGVLLRNEGAQVLCASSANEGLSTLHREPVDVLFTDLRLPDDDGLNVLQQARKVRPHLTTIILTGYASLDSSVEAMRRGACDYLTKPITQQKLHSAWIRALHAHECLKLGAEGSPSNGTGSAESPTDVIVAESAEMREILCLVARIAPTSVSVLLQGETGVGKSLIARVIHAQSQRMNGPFVRVNCGAIAGDLTAREMRSQVLAAFGGPEKEQTSLLERANGGTLFLDDVEQLPLSAQVQLLDVLQKGRSSSTVSTDAKTDLRLISSTTCDLEEQVARGRLRRGLFDELAVISIPVPPLRDRPEDIKALGQHYLTQFSRARGTSSNGDGLQFTSEAWECLLRYDWPGNLRELANTVKRAVLLTEGPELGPASLPDSVRRRTSEPRETISVPISGDIKEIERNVIHEVIERCNGNKTAAARMLGMHRRTLYRRLDPGTRG